MSKLPRLYFPSSEMDNFCIGMDREVLPFLPIQKSLGPVINLGAGNKMIPGTVPLDLPQWRAGERMPYEDEEVVGILAYHFFEHLTVTEVISVLRECERVLRLEGVLNVVVPHWDSEAANQDLDHKTRWSESTWRNLFQNNYYNTTVPRDWQLRERTTIIMGIVQRNLVIVSQLVKP